MARNRHKLPMKIHLASNNRRSSITFLAALILLPGCLLFAQATPPLAQPGKYTGEVITGDVVREATVNMSQLASAPAPPTSKAGTEIHPNRRPVLRPPVRDSGAAIEQAPAAPLAPVVAPTPNFRGFTGLTHRDQRNARGGNQWPHSGSSKFRLECL
jgi:hypothetical protein